MTQAIKGLVIYSPEESVYSAEQLEKGLRELSTGQPLPVRIQKVLGSGYEELAFEVDLADPNATPQKLFEEAVALRQKMKMSDDYPIKLSTGYTSHLVTKNTTVAELFKERERQISREAALQERANQKISKINRRRARHALKVLTGPNSSMELRKIAVGKLGEAVRDGVKKHTHTFARHLRPGG
ncbi:MAG: hypothetical protein WC612_00660 [Bdellovibrionales bacterium]